jgi:hypothetical protein
VILWRRDWPGILTVLDCPFLSIRYTSCRELYVVRHRWAVRFGRLALNHKSLNFELTTRKYPRA